MATVTGRHDKPHKSLSAMMYELAKRFVGRDDRLAAALMVAAWTSYMTERDNEAGGS